MLYELVHLKFAFEDDKFEDDKLILSNIMSNLKNSGRFSDILQK